MIALKMVKWVIVWKERDFADIVKDAKSVSGFSPSHQSRVGRNDVTRARPGYQDGFKMLSSEGAFFETNFLRIAGTPEADTSVSEKAKCLLAIGKDQKSKPLGVTFSLKIY